MIDRAKMLLYCIGELEDGFLEEAWESQRVAPRKKVVLYGALGLAATIGAVFAYKAFKKLATN